MSEVLTARAGPVLTITLNRPDVYNAINRAMHDGLAAALKQHHFLQLRRRAGSL